MDGVNRRGTGMGRIPRLPAMRPKAEAGELVRAILGDIARWAHGFVGRRNCQRMYPFDDAYQDAVVACVRGGEIYDPDHEKEATFKTYAVFWANQGMRKGLIAARLIRAPSTPPNRYTHLKARSARPVSLDDLAVDVDRVVELSCADDGPERREAVAAVRVALRSVPGRERKILMLRAGGMILQEVGAVMGITRERVRQLQLRGMAKLEKQLRRKYPGLGMR